MKSVKHSSRKSSNSKVSDNYFASSLAVYQDKSTLDKFKQQLADIYTARGGKGKREFINIIINQFDLEKTKHKAAQINRKKLQAKVIFPSDFRHNPNGSIIINSCLEQHRCSSRNNMNKFSSNSQDSLYNKDLAEFEAYSRNNNNIGDNLPTQYNTMNPEQGKFIEFILSVG